MVILVARKKGQKVNKVKDGRAERKRSLERGRVKEGIAK